LISFLEIVPAVGLAAVGRSQTPGIGKTNSLDAEVIVLM
jgi:hypothetical protein